LLISFTCIIGYFNLYGTIVNEYFSRYGLDDDETNYVGVIANFSGIVGCLIISAFLDKYKVYKKPFLILSCFGLICHVTMTILLELSDSNAFIILTVLWTFCSISVLPIFTISMDFVIELTYPVGESISGGVIMTCTQISGIISVLFLFNLDINL
jgi:Na+/melibiose symporter-like transporter